MSYLDRIAGMVDDYDVYDAFDEEYEKVAALDEISEFVKEAAIDIGDEDLYDAGEFLSDIAEDDAIELSKEAGMLSDTGSWIGEKGRAFGRQIASGASARDIRESYGRTRDIMKKPLRFLDSDARKALVRKKRQAVREAKQELRAAKHLPSGKRGQKIIAQNRADLRSALWQGTKGLGKTGLVYGAPAGALGYGAYRYGNRRR